MSSSQRNTNRAPGYAQNQPVSERRIKDAAKTLRKLLAERDPSSPMSAQTSLEWTAKLMGYASLADAQAAGAPAAGSAGIRLLYGHCSDKKIFSKRREVHLTERSILGHETLAGSTGSGKTETLVSRARSLMEAAPAAGCIYIDGKGDNSLYAKMFAHCSELGRVCGLRAVNLMTCRYPFDTDDHRKLSHTFNPLDGMDGRAEAQWLWETFGQSARRRGCAKEAQALFAAAGAAHAALKGAGGDDPGIEGLARWLSLRKLEKTSASARSALPADAWEALEALGDMAGDDWQSGPLAIAENISLPVLEAWAQNFPSVFSTAKTPSGAWLAPEVPRDWALRGGVVAVLLPALEKSADELALLGRGILAAFRSAWRENPCQPGTLSSMCIFDEIGYYAPDSYADAMQDARRAGAGLIFAGQDLASLCKSGKTEDEQKLMLDDLCLCSTKTLLKGECAGHFETLFAQSAFGLAAPTHRQLLDLHCGDAYAAMAGFCGQAKLRYVQAPAVATLYLHRCEACPEPAPQWTPGEAP